MDWSPSSPRRWLSASVQFCGRNFSPQATLIYCRNSAGWAEEEPGPQKIPEEPGENNWVSELVTTSELQGQYHEIFSFISVMNQFQWRECRGDLQQLAILRRGKVKMKDVFYTVLKFQNNLWGLGTE